MRKLLKRRSGEGYIDVCVLVVCAMLVLALVVRVLPVYITKQQLDTYAVELVREAEIAGRVGTETTRRAAALTDSTGLDPDIRWSTTGRIQLNDEVTVTLTLETDIGLFGGFGSFPITHDPCHCAGIADAVLRHCRIQPAVDHCPMRKGGRAAGGHFHRQ